MTQYQEPMDVLMSVREPYNKNTLWIYPFDKEDVELRVFRKGWKTILTTKDIGLSNLSLEQVNNTKEDLKALLLKVITKHSSRATASSMSLVNKERELEEKILGLERKIDRLTKIINKKQNE